MVGEHRDRLLGLCGVVGALVLWQVVVGVGLVSPTVLPLATETVAVGVGLLNDAGFWQAVGHTFAQWATGMALTCVIAIPAGLLLGRNGVVRSFAQSSIDFLRAIPTIALLPLFVLVFGSGLEMVALLITYAATWQLLIPTIAGAAGVDELAMDTARAFRLGRVRTFVRVVLPASLPLIATGLRLAATVALLVAIAAELIVGSPGLGHAMILAEESGELARVYALCAVAGLLGLVLNLGLRRLERWYLAWHPSITVRGGEV